METFRLFDLIFILLGAVFIGILLYLLLGFSRSYTKNGITKSQLTILIPIKNESNCLTSLIERLRELLVSQPQIKVRLINDHSTDLSPKFIAELNLDEQISLHNAGDQIFGKKAALNEAIKNVSSTWILFMDADAELPQNFFDHLHKPISEVEKCVLIPLSPIKRNGMASAFFDLDFLSLHFAGLKSALRGRPLLANGACMLINREAYRDSLPLRNDWSQQSGDDVYAMFAIAKQFGNKAISASANGNPPVKVSFPSHFKVLWSQRLRWIAKTGKIQNAWFQFVAISVLVAQMLLIVAAILIARGNLSVAALVAVILILISEILFLGTAIIKLNRRDLWIYIVPSVFIYPFYLLTLGIFSTFAKPKWK